MTMQRKGHELLISRLYDAIERVGRGQSQVVTSFLTPSEQEVALTICRKTGIVFEGGYPEAERKQAVIYDQYGWQNDFSDCGSETLNSQEQASRIEDERLQAVCLHAAADPSQRAIRHPDVLGALLHEGLAREAIGDILCSDTDIYLFCRRQMSEFIRENILQIARQNVRFEECSVSDLPQIQREVLLINVSSLRYDAVVAALAKVSRSKAEDMIRQGFVKINDVVLDQKGQLCNNDFVSIRRCGRFRLVREVKSTRKNRPVLEFVKYS